MIIDFRFSCPIPEGLDRYLKPKAHMAHYAEHYGARVYGEGSLGRYMEPSELIDWLDSLGVDRVLMKCADSETTRGTKTPMDKIYGYVRQRPDRLLAAAGVDPHKGMRAVRELEHAVKEYGFVACNMGPWELELHANDKRFYPIYTKCCELDIPVLLHTSMNLSRNLLMEYGRPIHLDEVARDFPELKIVAVHGGWPWMLEMVAVAWKQPNVYIEISGTRPKYIGTPNTGWEPLLQFGNGVLKNKVLWASNWPMLDPKEGIEGVRSFPLREEVKRMWLGENAARLLKLA
ncbi:MAG: amidohydrolase family protein [Nitrospinota bacterium]